MAGELTQQLCGRKKLQYLKLIELSDITKQLADAVNRKDEVSVKIMISMRQAPLTALTETQEEIETLLSRFPEEEAIRGNELINGAEARTPEEEPLCRQVAQNSRILAQIREMDREISQKLDPKRSFYKKFR